MLVLNLFFNIRCNFSQWLVTVCRQCWLWSTRTSWCSTHSADAPVVVCACRMSLQKCTHGVWYLCYIWFDFLVL